MQFALIASFLVAHVVSSDPLQSQTVYLCKVDTLAQEDALHSFDVFNHRWGVGSTVTVWPRSDTATTSLLSLIPSCIPRPEPLVYQNYKVDTLNEHLEKRKEDALDPFFQKFQQYSAIIQKLEVWEKEYPDTITYIPSIVETFENRSVPAIIITNKSIPDSKKKMIWWNGLQHAREWISGSTVLYLANQLLVLSQKKDAQVLKYLQEFQFVITPVNNPDGYEYTFNGDRYWRKNRRDNGNNDTKSFGVDLNRNWDDKWGIFGANTNIYSETYQGPHAFSEPETNGTANFISMFPNRYAGIEFHSYGELILRNWGYTDKDSPNEAILKRLGDGFRDAIYNVHQEVYTSEKGAGLYPASGCTDDWMSTEMGMVGFTIELRNTHSFELPVSQIPIVGEVCMLLSLRIFGIIYIDSISSNKEIWGGIKFYLDFLLENRNIPQQVPSAVKPVQPALFPIANDIPQAGKPAASPTKPAFAGAGVASSSKDRGPSVMLILSLVILVLLVVLLMVWFCKCRAVERLKYSLVGGGGDDLNSRRGLKRSSSSSSVSSSVELGRV
ncbi:UNVERIFIED_CONTAM: hypothetical protein HDU68_001151 [Siphonaria sp. JEL0065]|nr:hypothetical protein HDU68_001151 [Siphonaria sp. JEL0065]